MNQQPLPPGRFNKEASLQSIQVQGEAIEIYVPDAVAVQQAYRSGEIPFPFWSKVWPAAKALAAYMLCHPHYVQGRSVLELGAGLGLPSLVAARYAASVLCTDHAPEAVSLAQLSADHYGLANFRSAVLDWNHLPPALEADTVLLSDINYEPVAFNALMVMVNHFLDRGNTLLLSTPQRLMAKDFIAPLLAFSQVQEEIVVEENGKEVLTTVMVLKK